MREVFPLFEVTFTISLLVAGTAFAWNCPFGPLWVTASAGVLFAEKIVVAALVMLPDTDPHPESEL